MGEGFLIMGGIAIGCQLLLLFLYWLAARNKSAPIGWPGWVVSILFGLVYVAGVVLFAAAPLAWDLRLPFRVEFPVLLVGGFLPLMGACMAILLRNPRLMISWCVGAFIVWGVAWYLITHPEAGFRIPHGKVPLTDYVTYGLATFWGFLAGPLVALPIGWIWQLVASREGGSGGARGGKKKKKEKKEK
jgi:hypothetical protein